MARVLTLGFAAVDFVLSVPEFPDRPDKYRADSASIVGGGMAANAAVAAARLGGTVHLASRLGDDPLADIILSDLQADGVRTEMVRRTAGGRSPFSSVLVDGHGERQVVNFRGSGLADDMGWIDAAPDCDVVLVDTRWPAGAAAALDLARRRGIPGVLDGEAPIDPILLQKASHVAFSRQGLRSIADTDDLNRALRRVADRFHAWICVTDGARGAWYNGADGITHVPAFPVEAVDTLGAGDVWHGAFALALAEGQREATAVRFANAAAALKCKVFGGRSGTPDRASVETLLEEKG